MRPSPDIFFNLVGPVLYPRSLFGSQKARMSFLHAEGASTCPGETLGGPTNLEAGAFSGQTKPKCFQDDSSPRDPKQGERGKIGKFNKIRPIFGFFAKMELGCLLYTSPSPRDVEESRMPSSA